MVVVGTWNLENLFLPGGEFGPPDQASYDRKLASLARVITSSGVQVLGVQEVGDSAALDDLTGRLGPAWQTAVSTLPDRRGIRVGVLADRAIEVVVDEAVFPSRLAGVQVDDAATVVHRCGRGTLGVQVANGELGEITLLVSHLKSKLISYPGGRFAPRTEGERARYASYALSLRAAEAATVRGLADRVLDGGGREHHVVLLGDFNDAPAAATTQLLQGPPGSELGTPGAFVPDKGDAWRLWNLAPLLPPGSSTRVYRGRGELIDHIFVSRSLLRADLDVRTVSAAPLPSIGDDPTARQGLPGSDHALLAVTLQRAPN